MIDAAGIYDVFAGIKSEREIIGLTEPGDGRNEMLMFLKPECLFTGRENFISIVKMIEKKMQQYDVSIDGAVIIKGNRLKELRIIDRHYGFINLMSREASKHLDDFGDKIRDALGIENNREVEILGGNEFLKKYSQFDSETLNELWETKKSVKIRSGLYCELYEIEGKELVIVNGFHPAQLDYFTLPDRGIVIFLVQTDAEWKEMKNEFAGNTFPEKAAPGSVRGDIFGHKEDYGVDLISVSRNFVHLSAGPFEAAFEMMNFLGKLESLDFSAEMTKVLRDMKADGLGREDFERAISDPDFIIDGRHTDLFSETEEMNTGEAIEFYKKVFNRSRGS